MELPKRKKIRLKGYDYSQNGAYFITICTENRANLFGEIKNGVMLCSECGKIAFEEIANTNKLRGNNGIQIQKYIIMPNHIHMIIEIVGSRRAVTENPQPAEFAKPTKQSISTIIRAYKSTVTKRLHELDGHGTPCPYKIWQSRFYDHIIRDEQEYHNIWNYIDTNPLKWEQDCLHS